MSKRNKYDNRDYHECKWCNEVIHLDILGEWEHSKNGIKPCNNGKLQHTATPKR